MEGPVARVLSKILKRLSKLMYDSEVRVVLVRRIFWCVAVTTGLVAQLPNTPHAFYCGGNELRFEGNLKGSAVAGRSSTP